MKTKKNNVFGIRLRRFILARGETQREVAKRAGITEAALSYFIRGMRLPTAVSLYRLSRALDVSMNELWEGGSFGREEA